VSSEGHYKFTDTFRVRRDFSNGFVTNSLLKLTRKNSDSILCNY